jgi:hypothetical protein
VVAYPIVNAPTTEAGVSTTLDPAQRSERAGQPHQRPDLVKTRSAMPDVRVDAYVSPGTLLVAAVLGILAVAAAPLLLTRRVQTMDVPAMLRVLE